MKNKIIFTVGLNLIVAATAVMVCPAIFVSLFNILHVALICGFTICHILDTKGDIVRKAGEDYFTSALPALPFVLGLIVTIFIPTDNIELKAFVLSVCVSGAWWGCCYSNYLYSTGDEDIAG